MGFRLGEVRSLTLTLSLSLSRSRSLPGEGGLPEPRQGSKPFDLREYIADAFEDLNEQTKCSQISIFEPTDFHKKEKP